MHHKHYNSDSAASSIHYPVTTTHADDMYTNSFTEPALLVGVAQLLALVAHVGAISGTAGGWSVPHR